MYHAIGFVIVWGLILLISVLLTYIIGISLLHLIRAIRVLKVVGKNKKKSYIHCIFLVWRESMVWGTTISYNGRYFPLIGKSYFKEEH